MKSIALGRMLLDGRHVIGCRYDLDDAMLGARLAQIGLTARLYSGKSEGRVVDMARQFVRMRADAYLFAVEPVTVSLMLQIVRQMRALMPAARIFFRGAIDETRRQSLPLDEAGVHWLPSAAEACAAEIAALIGRQEDMPPLDDASSPYLSGLVHEDDLCRIGLSADQPLAVLSNELAWLSRETLGDAPIPVLAATRSDEDIGQIAKMLEDCGSSATFNLLQHPQQRSANPPSFGLNGVIALRTGIYGDPASGTRHFEVSSATAPEQRREAYAWAGPHMASRSAVVFRDEAPGERIDLEAFATPLTLETNGWPMHSYLFESASPTEGRVSFDGEPGSRQPIRTMPLSDFDGSRGDGDAITFISLTRAADVEAFERRLRIFSDSGRMHIEDPHRQKYFENSCRWTRRGTCQLTSLKRIQLKQDMRLSSCRDAGDIGSLRDGYDEIVIQLKRNQQTQGIHRECAVCPVRDDCSQCTQLPADWAGRYCAIRKAHACAPLYIEIFSMAHGLAALFAAGDEPALDLLVSYSGLPNQHFAGTPAEPRDGQRPVILSANGRHIAWWRGTKRLCRLSAPLALMAEAWWSSGSEDQIVSDLSSKFKVSSSVATTSFETGVEKLRSEGIIHA